MYVCVYVCLSLLLHTRTCAVLLHTRTCAVWVWVGGFVGSWCAACISKRGVDMCL